jgi:hypothetical protein
MPPVTTTLRNGNAASGYAKVGDIISASLAGFTGTNAATLVISGPDTEATFSLAALAGGAGSFAAVGGLRALRPGVYTCVGRDASGVTDPDTVQVFRVSP